MLNAAISCNDEGNQELKVVYAKIRKRELFFIAVKSLGSLEPETTRRLAAQSELVDQLFHGPAPRSPLHRLGVRLRHSRSNTSTEYSLPGATQLNRRA